MDISSAEQNKTRKRAAQACQRCNKRKIKCDVASQTNGTPCSRCRMDNVANECTKAPSRRGTYERKAHWRKRTGQGRGTSAATSLHFPARAGDRTVSRPTSDQQHTRRSLASLFEDFLDQNGYDRDDTAAAQLGIILVGESSPLTFALKDSVSASSSNFYDAAPDLSRSKRRGQHAHEYHHPPHCSAEEIAFLSARGAFTAPEDQLREQLVTAFLDRFYPLYAIFNKSELLRMHQTRGLKWILLHAICFIGATFCEASVLHGSVFKSRLHARRSFYDRAKVLFDTGYEIDKFSLLQTTIMMSFWGPQMKSYWNPCSWIGFAVTIAESLGIHRSTSSAHVNGKDKNLVRRLWWSLVIRDAYCATLLGRPFRINIDHCDTEMLEIDDFGEDASSPEECPDYALYQIHVARLSVILRRINQSRFGIIGRSELNNDLDQWWQATPISGNNVFFTSLQTLYHYHRILIHLNVAKGPCHISRDSSTSGHMEVFSAQTIASTASSLVTKQLTTQIPHEVFTGYFLAGIILHRQLQQSDSLPSQVARSSFDNCQMLLNEVREVWDPAHWIMQIFEFLLSSKSNTSESRGQHPSTDSGTTARSGDASSAHMDQACNDDLSFPANIDDLYSVDWSLPVDMRFGDFLGMPPFLEP